MDQRLELVQTTLKAQLKLAEELHPMELQAHQHSPDPVAEALAARQAALQAAVDSCSNLLGDRVPRSSRPETMMGYYGLLEALLKSKDQDATKFKEVLAGKLDESLL